MEGTIALLLSQECLNTENQESFSFLLEIISEEIEDHYLFVSGKQAFT